MCRERIDRAEIQIKVLELKLRQFRKKHPIKVVPKQEGNRVRWDIFTSFIDMPIDMPMILGEVIYQIRAALNNAVFYCGVKDNNGVLDAKKEKLLDFPFHKSRVKLKKRVKKMGLSDERWRIIDSVQSYSARSDQPECTLISYRRALRFLDEWAVIDRHRSMHLVAGVARLEEHSLSVGDKTVRQLGASKPVFLGDHSEIELSTLTIDIPADVSQVQANAKLALIVAVEDTESLPENISDDLISRLNTIVEAARAVIDALEASYR